MKKFVIITLLIIGFFIAGSMLTGLWLSAPRYTGPQSDHFNGKKFENLGGVAARGFKDLVKWALNRQQGPWQQLDALPGTKPPPQVHSGIRVTFVNHSTFLIQMEGINILTDPVWSERASPFSIIGPKRMRPPGIPFEDLPSIDVVLISHNHYDHLDIPTIKRLVDDHQPRIYTPLGVGAFLDGQGLGPAIDLDWWNSRELSETVQLHAVPAQHFSGRGIGDRNATLWCGYVLDYAQGQVYFAGDTGYGPFVHEIARRFPAIDLSLLPIGAYLPIWFMSPIHTSPQDAAQMHLDLNSKKSLGIHFGTFPMADDGMTQPLDQLDQALEYLAIPRDHFITLPEGEFLLIEGDDPAL